MSAAGWMAGGGFLALLSVISWFVRSEQRREAQERGRWLPGEPNGDHSKKEGT